MRQRISISISTLLMFVVLVPAALAQSPEATPSPPSASPVTSGSDWQITDVRSLNVEGEGFTLSPDGQWLAGVGPDSSPCFWEIQTLTPACADEQLPMLVGALYPSMAWAPDSSAVTFSLDAVRMLNDSDIYVFERESQTLTNLTEDGYEGGVLDAPSDAPIDIAPTWSPDGRQIAFARSFLGDTAHPTTIMRINRAGGNPVEVFTLDLAEPFLIWMPMYWLPDDTIVFSEASADIDNRDTGVWRVGIDGSDPGKLIPGDAAADIPIPMVVDMDAGSGVMSVYSLLLFGQFATSWEDAIFWIGDLDTGEITPLPPVDTQDGAVLPGTPASPESSLANPTSPATLSPDGSAALVVYRSLEGDSFLVTVDVASGELTLLDSPEALGDVLTVAPQWQENDTVLLPMGSEAPVLIELEHAD